MTAQLQGLSGIPGVSEKFNSFIQTVRLFMRDYPQLNLELAGAGTLQVLNNFLIVNNSLTISAGTFDIGVSLVWQGRQLGTGVEKW